MADVRVSQNVAQVEWQAPPLEKISQVVAQVEYAEPTGGAPTSILDGPLIGALSGPIGGCV